MNQLNMVEAEDPELITLSSDSEADEEDEIGGGYQNARLDNPDNEERVQFPEGSCKREVIDEDLNGEPQPSTSRQVSDNCTSSVSSERSPIKLGSEECKNCKKIELNRQELYNKLRHAHKQYSEQEELLSEALEDNLTWKDKHELCQDRVRQQEMEITKLKLELRESRKKMPNREETNVKVRNVPGSLSNMSTRSRDTVFEHGGLLDLGTITELGERLKLISNQVQQMIVCWNKKGTHPNLNLEESGFRNGGQRNGKGNYLSEHISKITNGQRSQCRFCDKLSDQIQVGVEHWVRLENNVRVELSKTKENLLTLQKQLVLHKRASNSQQEEDMQVSHVDYQNGNGNSPEFMEMDEPSTAATTVPSFATVKPTARKRGRPAKQRSTDDDYSYLAFPTSPTPPHLKRKRGPRGPYRKRLVPTRTRRRSIGYLVSTSQTDNEIHGFHYFTTAKRFKCKCGLLYKNKCSLVKHIKLKEDGKVFPCNLCDKQFARSDYVIQHMKQVHHKKPIRLIIKNAPLKRSENPLEASPPPPEQPSSTHSAPGEASESWLLEDDGELRVHEWMEAFQLPAAVSPRNEATNQFENSNHNQSV